jgi:hypothetical protein
VKNGARLAGRAIAMAASIESFEMRAYTVTSGSKSRRARRGCRAPC